MDLACPFETDDIQIQHTTRALNRVEAGQRRKGLGRALRGGEAGDEEAGVGRIGAFLREGLISRDGRTNHTYPRYRVVKCLLIYHYIHECQHKSQASCGRAVNGVDTMGIEEDQLPDLTRKPFWAGLL